MTPARRQHLPVDDGSSFEALVAPWAEIITSRRPIRFPPGSTILSQGDPPDQLYLIVGGAAKIVRGERDRRDVIVAIRGGGWLLGVASAVLNDVHPASAQALGWCDVLPVSAVAFQARARTETRQAVEALLARDLFEQVLRAGSSAMPAHARVKQLLVDLGRQHGRKMSDGSTRILVRLTQADIADLVVASRETVNSVLQALERGGGLRREDGWLVVPDSRLSKSLC